MSYAKSFAEFSGGIDLETSDTFVTGSAQTAHVVNYRAKYNIRDQLLRFQALDSTKTASTKQLLSLIGLSQPISFDKEVYYDDDEDKKKYDKHKLPDNNPVVTDMLLTHIQSSPCNMINVLISQFNLGETTQWAMIELIAYLVRHLKVNNSNMRKVKIDNNISHMLDRIHNGRSLFEVVSCDNDHPNRLNDAIIMLLDKVSKSSPRKGKWPTTLDKIPKRSFPKLTPDIQNTINMLRTRYTKGNQYPHGPTAIKKMVKCIITMNTALMDQLILIEQYYYDVATDTQHIHNALMKFFTSSTVKHKQVTSD